MSSSNQPMSINNDAVTLLSREISIVDDTNIISETNVGMESVEMLSLPFPNAQASTLEVNASPLQIVAEQNTWRQERRVDVYERDQRNQYNQIYVSENQQASEESELVAHLGYQYGIQPNRGDGSTSFDPNQTEEFSSNTSHLPSVAEQTPSSNGLYQPINSMEDVNQYRSFQFDSHFDDRSIYPTISSISTTSYPVASMILISPISLPSTPLNLSRSLSTPTAQIPEATQNSPNNLNLLAPTASNEVLTTSDSTNSDNRGPEFKSDLYDFLLCMRREALSTSPNFSRRIPCPSYLGIEALRAMTPKVIQRSDLRGEKCDMQGINWKEIRVSKSQVRKYRIKNYYKDVRNLNSIPLNPKVQCKVNCENIFRFRRMDFSHKIQLLHTQLRNLISSPTRGHIFYVGRSKIIHCTPYHAEKSAIVSIALDLTKPKIPSPLSTAQGVHITTMATGENLLVAGGFFGEYGLINLNAEKGTEHTQGLITRAPGGITNHIQIHSTRNSTNPIVAFASNNSYLRLLDVCTNRVISEQPFEYAINCSSISSDKRLRVMVGDTQKILICNAESGEILKILDGHDISGNACDWADDGWTIATGGQDHKIKIWDARKLTTIQGISLPVTVISTQMAGVSKLKFSPLGSGKRILVAAEPIDTLNIIDAERYSIRQTISLFGDITGFDFCNDGQDLYVANSDRFRGGIVEFERSNLASSSCYDLRSTVYSKKGVYRHSESYDWKSEEEMIRNPKTRTTQETLERRSVSLGEKMGYF